MRKLFELARAYPIESVVRVGDQGFAVCSGIDKHIEEWRGLAEPVVGRIILPLTMPATRINSYHEGTYCCQNLDTLMMVDLSNIQTLQLNDELICSQTVQMGERLAHLTSNAHLNIYTSQVSSPLTMVSSNKVSILENRTTKSILAVSNDQLAYNDTSGQFELYNIDRQASSLRIPLHPSSQVKDMLLLNANAVAILTTMGLDVVDLRVRRISVRMSCPSTTNTIRKGKYSNEILFDSDGQQISSIRLGYPSENYLRFSNRNTNDSIKYFEWVGPNELAVVNGRRSTLEVFTTE